MLRTRLWKKKIVELDARPSDCLAIAARAGAPIYITRDVWNSLEDRSTFLEQMRTDQEPDGDIHFDE